MGIQASASGSITTGLARINWELDINALMVESHGNLIANDNAIRKVLSLSSQWSATGGANLLDGTKTANEALASATWKT